MSTGPKQAIFAEFAKVMRALAHPHRLELVEQLAQGERTVEVLAQRTGLSVANASQHLQQLKQSGLVVSQREGRFVLYRLSDDGVLDLLACLRRVAERNVAGIDRIVRDYFHGRDEMEAVSREELLARLRAGDVTVLDVRPADEFGLGHLPGALNVQLADLECWLENLDAGRDVIAYCRGAYCILSYEAVALLRARGFRAWRLEDGLPEWRAAGLPVALGTDTHREISQGNGRVTR